MNHYSKFILVCAVLGLLSGCTSLLPKWTIFQKEVPAPIVKPVKQIEAERQTADYIARVVEKPPELKPLAVSLSESLGHPEKPLVGAIDDVETRMVKAWEKVLLQDQQQRESLDSLLAKYGGKKIEGTGYNVFGFTMSGAVIILVILVILFPPIGIILWSVFKRLSGALASTVKGVSNYIKENPESGQKLKGYLKDTQDLAHKKIISKVKLKQ